MRTDQGNVTAKLSITEKSTISFSIGVLVILIGAVAWLTRLDARMGFSEANASANSSQQTENTRILRTIDRRLSRIEGKLGVRARDE